MTRFEDIMVCPLDNYGSGIRSRLYYAPAAAFSKLILPEDGSNIIKKGDLSFYIKKGWSFIDILVDEGELKAAQQGGVQRKKMAISLDFFILKFSAENFRKIEAIKNEPMVFLVIDGNGQQWLLGTLRNRAFVDKLEGTTAKKYEENAGFSFSVISKSNLYAVEGDSTQLYVGPDYVWVLADNNLQPILFDNNKLLEI